LPDEPGVYLFRDARGKVIYVGKAKSIRKRVASHFSNPSTRGGTDLVDEIDHIEALVVHTEAEALLAEQNFIKQYKPRFNIRLRDDKSYPYIAISLDEDFPRVYFTRERHRRDRAYFGPYSNPSPGGAQALHASTTTSSAARRRVSATSARRTTDAGSTV
jgi:excinuclease ABC subunit C